ncbi:hypothetical protein OOZ15_00620 [Galbibacter sp. EGI 63066]|uniref:hypothetical protein n=1 Tax=Galbibacter sp. EGI 63066 TaxID=2993559 RepID=UPI0022493414|nr:hypothetical protein [Galbibacter sp. EGI 63066]MCX2678431.1 hypothetical protein [Galbibacter sp. EGI 63066]
MPSSKGHTKQVQYAKSFKEASQDSDVMLMAEKGMGYYFKIIQEFEQGFNAK